MKTIVLLFLTTFFIFACDRTRQEKANNLFEQGKKLEAEQLPDSAMILYQQAINELKRVKDDTLSGIIYNQIGNLLLNNELYSDAFEPFSKALIYNSKISNKTEASRSLRGMGKSRLYQEAVIPAIEYYKSALLLSPHITNQEEISLIHNNLSSAYLELGNYNLSLAHNTKATQLSRDSINIYKNYNIRGCLFMKSHQYDSAWIYYKLGCNSNDLYTQASCYYALIDWAKATNNIDSAKYISIFQILKDSIEDKSRSFEILKKDKQYYVNITKKELDDKYGYLIAIILILSIIFIIIFTKQHRSEKIKNKKLSGFAKKLQLEMSKLECELERAAERNEIKKKLIVSSQLQDVQAIVIKDIKKLGNKATTNFRRTESYKKLKEILASGEMKEKERNANYKKLQEAFAPFNTYLITFLDFSSDDCLYCCLSLLKFKTNECALFRNITEDAIRSQKRRLKCKINEIFDSEELYEYIFMKTK